MDRIDRWKHKTLREFLLASVFSVKLEIRFSSESLKKKRWEGKLEQSGERLGSAEGEGGGDRRVAAEPWGPSQVRDSEFLSGTSISLVVHLY